MSAAPALGVNMICVPAADALERGLRRQHGTEDGACAKCACVLWVGSFTAKLKTIFPKMEVFCPACGVALGLPNAALVYTRFYGRPAPNTPASGGDPITAAVEIAGGIHAPYCPHTERPWTPVITLTRPGGAQLGRWWIPRVFCQGCSGELTAEKFRDDVRSSTPLVEIPSDADTTWRLEWWKLKDLGAQIAKTKTGAIYAGEFRRVRG